MLNKLFLIIFVFLSLSYSGVLFAAANSADLYPFATPKQAKQFHHLSKQFRCLVCQNESLADSNAPLAKDLRYQIYKMITQHKSNKEITNFLVSRYGDFILFQPPMSPYTFFLWFGPLVLLMVALARLFWLIYQRKKQEQGHPEKQRFSKADREKIKHLLQEH